MELELEKRALRNLEYGAPRFRQGQQQRQQQH